MEETYETKDYEIDTRLKKEKVELRVNILE
jgi:hypothetical protein